MAIVLASQSPRRQELLARIGVEDFKALSLDIDESYPEGLSPEDTVRYIAKKKCDAAAALCAPDDLIITADTMVFLGNDRLGKPQDEVYYEEYKKVYKKIVKEFNCEHLGIIYNVNIGHAAPMGLLPLGIEYQIDLDNKKICFKESGVNI